MYITDNDRTCCGTDFFLLLSRNKSEPGTECAKEPRTMKPILHLPHKPHAQPPPSAPFVCTFMRISLHVTARMTLVTPLKPHRYKTWESSSQKHLPRCRWHEQKQATGWVRRSVRGGFKTETIRTFILNCGKRGERTPSERTHLVRKTWQKPSSWSSHPERKHNTSHRVTRAKAT